MKKPRFRLGNIVGKVVDAVKGGVRKARTRSARLSIGQMRRFGHKYFKNMRELQDADVLERKALSEFYESHILEIDWPLENLGQAKGRVNISSFYEPEWNIEALDNRGRKVLKLEGKYPDMKIEYLDKDMMKAMKLAKHVLALLPPLYVIYVVKPAAEKFAPKRKRLNVPSVENEGEGEKN